MVFPAALLQSFIWTSLMATGVQYEVTHIISSMCVVRQSTVLIPCKYTHAQDAQVSAVEWTREKSPDGGEVRLSQDPAFDGRVVSQADHGNCSMLLRDVRESDAGIFRIVLSTASRRNFTNAQGIRLEVTDADVEVKTQSDIVMEGDWILFICGSCIPSMSVPTYIWRKGERLLREHHGNNLFDLESVELEDRGQYFCTISGHEGLSSTSVNITIRPGYPPQNVSVSVSPSGEIVEGDSVTLNCISDAKPPAKISWFKENETSAVGSGQSFSISSFNSRFSGRFSCEAHNKHGSQRSASVSVGVKAEESSWSSITVTVGITAAAVMTVMLMLVVWLWIRRKRVTPSEEQNQRGSRQHQKVASPEDAYMTLDPKSRCSEYDTLDNMKRSCDADEPEDQDPTYYNTDE